MIDQQIIDLLKARGGMKPLQIIPAICQQKAVVYEALYRMADEGRLVRTGNGFFTLNGSFIQGEVVVPRATNKQQRAPGYINGKDVRERMARYMKRYPNALDKHMAEVFDMTVGNVGYHRRKIEQELKPMEDEMITINESVTQAASKIGKNITKQDVVIPDLLDYEDIFAVLDSIIDSIDVNDTAGLVVKNCLNDLSSWAETVIELKHELEK